MRTQQGAQTGGCLLAVDAAGCHVEYERFPIIRIFRGSSWIRQQIVGVEKDQAGAECGAFVAIDERMVAADIKKVRGSDFNRVGKQRFTKGGGLGCSDRRFEHAAISQTCAATVGD